LLETTTKYVPAAGRIVCMTLYWLFAGGALN